MDKALLRGRQIFKFGLLNKKNNKKNLKIRLVFNRMVVAFFRPTILIQTVTSNPKKTDSATMNRQKRHHDSQPFAKLKEVFCLRTCRHKNTTTCPDFSGFNFAQPHPKPTHHPTSGQRTM